MAVEITLSQGDAVIATRTLASLTGDFTEYAFELSALERSRITDLGGLALTITSGAGGERVSSVRVELNAPHPVAPGELPGVASTFFAFF